MPAKQLKKQAKRIKKGVSTIEVLVVVAIIALLVVLLLATMQKQVERSRDAHRKADLERVKISFEDYYNDKGCYPDPEVLNQCNSGSFRPYLSAIPCDPLTKEPYLYQPLGDVCKGYRVYSKLEDKTDPIIEALGCAGSEGCGYSADYVYGVAAGVQVYDPDGPAAVASQNNDEDGASPSPSGTIYIYACDSSGVCNQFEEGHPALEACGTTYSTPQQCETAGCPPSVRCIN